MKLADAKAITEGANIARGYRVSFEMIQGSILRSEHVPDRSEDPFETETEAWEWAAKLARSRPDFVNVYVVDHRWRPVPSYKSSMLNPHSPGQGR